MHTPSSSSGTFEIIAHAPSVAIAPEEPVDDLSSAIQSIFPMTNVDAEIRWCGYSVPVNYKYDLSVIVEDVVEMLEACAQGTSIDISFGSNTLNADWSMTCCGEEVRLKGVWHSVVGDIEEQLNSCPRVAALRHEFVSQWCSVLREAIGAVENTGIEITDDSLLQRARKLCETH